MQGTVFDVGGRPNKTRLVVPLDTDRRYIGLKPLFGKQINGGAIAQFDIVNVNRSGEEQPILDISYEVRRVYYDYNWYYSDGWRWRRVRVDEEVVEVTSAMPLPAPAPLPISVPVPVKKKGSKLKIFIALILVGAIGGAAYYFLA